MGTITSANAILTLAQATLFPVPVQMQGFAADDVYDIDGIASVETAMGVDGVLSAGFVFAPAIQNITLQADSLSNNFFDILWAQMQAAKDVYRMAGIMALPSISKKWAMTGGVLSNWKPAPDGKRTLQPRKYQITWERIFPQPL